MTIAEEMRYAALTTPDDHLDDMDRLLRWAAEHEALQAEVARLRKAVELALKLFEDGAVDFQHYGFTEDRDIAAFYRKALAGGEGC